MVANTKLLPTDDTMSGGFTHENFISEDTSVPANRQNKDTSLFLKLQMIAILLSGKLSG